MLKNGKKPGGAGGGWKMGSGYGITFQYLQSADPVYGYGSVSNV